MFSMIMTWSYAQKCNYVSNQSALDHSNENMHVNDPSVSTASYSVDERGKRRRRRSKERQGIHRGTKTDGENEVMRAPTSPRLSTLHSNHPLFSIPSGQTLSVFLTSPPSPLYICISHSSFPSLHLSFLHLSVTLSYSPEMTPGTRDLAVKCQIFIDVFFFKNFNYTNMHMDFWRVEVPDGKEKFFCHLLLSFFSTSSPFIYAGLDGSFSQEHRNRVRNWKCQVLFICSNFAFHFVDSY